MASERNNISIEGGLVEDEDDASGYFNSDVRNMLCTYCDMGGLVDNEVLNEVATSNKDVASIKRKTQWKTQYFWKAT